MRVKVFYIPIMCCEKEMAEIWEGDKRVGAYCTICQKKWEPPTPESKIIFGQKYFVHAAVPEDLENFVANYVKNAINSDIDKMLGGHIWQAEWTEDSEDKNGKDKDVSQGTAALPENVP